MDQAGGQAAPPAEYRVYTLDGAGHILRSKVLTGATDDEAVFAARQFDAHYAKEVWSLARFVTRIDAVPRDEDE